MNNDSLGRFKMKIESKLDEQVIELILNGFKKAKLDQSLADALELLKACDHLQRTLNEFKKPSEMKVIENKIVPIKSTGKKK